MYDVFLADHRILQILYNKLGKAFINKKGVPYLVNLTRGNVRSEFLNVIQSTHYRISDSKSLSVRVGRLSMSSEEILDNMVAIANGVVQKVPKGWHSIQSLSVKTTDSIALPVFNSMAVKPSKIIL